MKIKGIDGLTVSQIQNEVDGGGKFVFYSYCFSLVVMTFKKTSAVYFIRENESAFLKGTPFTLISFLFGWWGIPWGIIYTIGSLVTNLGGGKNVTAEVLQLLHKQTSGHVFEFETAAVQ
ncbi:hypothetical protein [Flavisolibacter nicotianae]|uniref:hypothetical protein n=1 Tax=Flavisolibacter nicotianae TaxID=2364882 RepID=UPI000EB59E8A|nr:hypothetical protein [Flavisolibacter nicotianae]